MWARACQSEFPTTEVVLVGLTLADSYDAKRFVFIFSIVVFVLPFGFYIVSLVSCRCNPHYHDGKENQFCDRIGNAYNLLCILIEIIFQIVLIIYQSLTIVTLNAINPALIRFAIEN